MKTNTKVALGVVAAVLVVAALFTSNTKLFQGSIKRVDIYKSPAQPAVPAIVDAPNLAVVNCSNRSVIYDSSTGNFDTFFDNFRREVPTSGCTYEIDALEQNGFSIARFMCSGREISFNENTPEVSRPTKKIRCLKNNEISVNLYNNAVDGTWGSAIFSFLNRQASSEFQANRFVIYRTRTPNSVGV